MELAPESAAWLYAVDSLSNTADEQSISLRCLLRVGTYLGLKVPRLFKHLNICLENSHEIERNFFALSLSIYLSPFLWAKSCEKQKTELSLEQNHYLAVAHWRNGDVHKNKNTNFGFISTVPRRRLRRTVCFCDVTKTTQTVDDTFASRRRWQATLTDDDDDTLWWLFHRVVPKHYRQTNSLIN